MLNNRTIKNNSIFILLFLLTILGCGDKEKMESFCQISFKVNTDELIQGSIIPISIQAGEGSNLVAEVQLTIDNSDIGLIPTAPNLYYWNTKGTTSGTHSIKAIYTSPDNSTITDEQYITLTSSTVICPQEVVDIDGNSYPVIQLGNQCWTQKNLITTHYPDGEPLSNGIDSLVSPSSTPGWYFAYAMDIANVEKYGYLYTWASALNGDEAANDSPTPIQGICPDGWHVPSVEEWRTLIEFVGGAEGAGNHLKDTSMLFWASSTEDIDITTGFNAVPGGCRVWNSSYILIEQSAYFWTATETIPNHAYHVFINHNESRAFVLGKQDSKRFGYSVRCVMD